MKSEKRYQHFALDENGKIINVHDVKDRHQQFLCPYCKHEMIPKMGDIRDWHFAHKHNTEDCDYDHYLHTIAEHIICNWLFTAKEVPLILKTTKKCEHFDNCPIKDKEYCTKPTFLPKSDLSHWIDSWTLEKTFKKNGQEFRADILGHNKNNEDNPIFIEICVTHTCEKEKLDSGIKIIEFKIESEQDIINIIHNPIREGRKTIFHNFHPKDVVGPCNDFNLSLKRFILYPSGKGFVKDITCHEYNFRRGIFEMTMPLSPKEDDIPMVINGEFWSPSALMFSMGYIMAHKACPNAKHCHICRWHAKTSFRMEHICMLYKRHNTNKYCSDNDATKCEHFQVNRELEEQMTKIFNERKDGLNIDIWTKDRKD